MKNYTKVYQRIICHRNINNKTEYLVEWKDGSSNSWETPNNFSDKDVISKYWSNKKKGEKSSKNNSKNHKPAAQATRR